MVAKIYWLITEIVAVSMPLPSSKKKKEEMHLGRDV
jgi:hypothetical protein